MSSSKEIEYMAKKQCQKLRSGYAVSDQECEKAANAAEELGRLEKWGFK